MSRLGVMLGAAAVGAYVAMALRPSRVRVSAETGRDCVDLLERVAEVEREPELIPFVDAVVVRDRREGRVVYRADVRCAGLSGWALFEKRIDPGAGYAVWRTLDGRFGVRQHGRLDCAARETGGRIIVDATTSFGAPVVGPILTHLATPVLRHAFGVWVRNLARGAAASRA